MWKLVIEDDEGKRTVVPLTRDDYTLGRREGNTIRLTERNVSRDHALLRKKMNGGVSPSLGATFTLHDCSSYNGVYVNGIRVIDGHELQHGDLIQIGDYRLILQDDSISDQPGAVGQTAEDGKTTLPLGVTRGSLLLERPNRLVMLAGPTPGAEFPLALERLTIGRAEDANISVNHNSVSRMHCEIHSLGESRFEIVDKGSSNGVRVNGADLRRGIIEAGDILELGDVRFKFVGAGQVFVPGVTESAQLEALSDRTASASLGRGVTSPKAILFFVLSVILLVAVVTWAAIRPRTPAPEALPVGLTAENGESMALAEAKRLCAAGDCDRAHDKLFQGIASSSPLRDSDDFKMIENLWGNHQLDRAQNEPDPAKRAAILEPLAQAQSVDPTLRKTANDRLNQLNAAAADAGGTSATTAPNGTASSVTPSAVPNPAAVPSATSATAAKPPHSADVATNSAPHAPAPKPPTASTNPPSGGGSLSDKARNMMLADPQGAKALLVPRVMGGKASREEIVLLRTICKELRDQVCVTACDEKLKAAP